ncbi:MBL fold metallo-hydrolase [Phormidium sp. CLA17]|nr:MBL fold metallo-hydrolase [Leptolyngbya sp. Cla-17]
MDAKDTANSSAVFSFSPSRDTLGGTAYLIVEEVNILIDCPAWNDINQHFLQQQGGVQWLVLTHRGAIGKVKEIQQTFGCNILIQEQEAYLLPGLTVTSFHQHFELTSQSHAIWTSGHSPGSSCLHYSGFGGVLFTGRHLLPTPQGAVMPIKTAKTFHWRRQLQNLQKLVAEFTPETLRYLCPGANIGFLRGKPYVDQAYEHMSKINDEQPQQGCLPPKT